MRTALLLSLALAGPALADAGDDTLRFYLARSDLVVVGEVATDPIGLINEAGVPNYICDFRVTEVLKGKKPAGATVPVNIIRFELEEGDHLPELKKGGKLILFLKPAPAGSKPAWVTADVWFGAQRAGPWMARSLKELADAEAKEKR